LRANIIGLSFWLVLSALVASFGGLFQPGDWYLALSKPAWTPPGWIFGPVWTFLYIAMAVAAWLVWKTGGWSANRPALAVYGLQLILNGAWSWIFFGEHRIGWALVDIIGLFILISITMSLFWRRRRAAGWLLLPYAVWVGFASVLNYYIVILN
jgi:tryptophan-rich sensory protein